MQIVALLCRFPQDDLIALHLAPRELFTTSIDDILEDARVGIVVECMGGVEPARTFILRALSSGKTVVTSNKEVMSKHWHEFEAAAKQTGAGLYLEATVGGGLPIIRTITDSMQANNISRVMGIIMLATFVAYMAVNVLQMKNTPAGEQEASEEEEMPLAKTLILLVLGAVLIAAGANLLVDNGTLIAQALGVPESVIALTFVALGTSLPELVTAITSLVKGHSDLSLGNVVGANVFNLVLVSGMSITLAPFTIPQSATLFGINSSLVLDLPVMLAVMLILTVPALVKGKLNRAQGILLLAIYAAFCAVQFAL